MPGARSTHDRLRATGSNGSNSIPPRWIPIILLKLMAPLSDRRGGIGGAPPSLRETISAGDNVTYWASAAKAKKELGFSARPLEQGVKDTYGGTT